MAARHAAALAAVLVLSGGCSLAGRTFGAYVDDALVKVAVKRQLSRDGVTSRGGVNVDTFGGTVYLTGIVDSDLQKSDAEIAAWQVDGVRQVVNDLVVRGDAGAPSASPSPAVRHPVLERLPGVARVEPARPGGPDLAYDIHGHVVATVYTVSTLALVDRGPAMLGADGRRIDHVEILALPSHSELPAPQYAVVLWHIGQDEAAGLR